MTAIENRVKVNATERGTIIHKLMEFNLKEEIGVYDCKKETNKADYEYSQIEQKVTEEMIEVADYATQQVLDIYDWYRRRDPTTYMISEGYVHWADKVGIPDAYIVTQDYIHIIELKTGINYDIHNPWDEIYRGYAAGVLRQAKQEKEEIRVTVINGFDYKTIDEPYTGNQINYWHDELIKQLEYEALMDSGVDELTLEINRINRAIDRRIAENPLDITEEFLNTVDEMAKRKTPVFNKAKEQVLEGKAEYEGYELKSRTKNMVDEDRLIDYLVEKEGMDRGLFKAFKAHRGNIRAYFDSEINEWVDEEEIFYSVDTTEFNFSKKK